MRASGPRNGPSRRTWAEGSGVIVSAVAVVGLLLIFGSATAALLPAKDPTVKFVAPYSGVESNELFAEPTGCGTTISVPVAPHFNLTSGEGTTSVATTSKPCDGANSTDYLDSTVGFQANPFTAATAGNYEIITSWSLSFSTKLSVKPGTTTETPYSGFEVYGQAFLECSNGTVYTQSNTPEVANEIFTGSFSHTYSRETFAIYVNATLPSSPTLTYSVITYWVVELFTQATPGSTSASASVNIGTSGHHGTLSSYSIIEP